MIFRKIMKVYLREIIEENKVFGLRLFNIIPGKP